MPQMLAFLTVCWTGFIMWLAVQMFDRENWDALYWCVVFLFIPMLVCFMIWAQQPSKTKE